jgi:hypothetical protein
MLSLPGTARESFQLPVLKFTFNHSLCHCRIKLVEHILLEASRVSRNECYDLRAEVFMAVKMSGVVLWVVTQCSLAGGYPRFGGTYRLHIQSRISSPSSMLKMEVTHSSKMLTTKYKTQTRRPQRTQCYDVL